MRARERRVGLVVGGAEERGDRVGVEGGVETRAGLAWGGGRGGHGGQPTKPGGQLWSRVGLTKYYTRVHSLLMPSVYLETTIPSFLVARVSDDDGLAEKQAITRTWWEDHRHRYELVTSEIVLEEAALGDESQSTLRLRSLNRVRVLGPTEDVEFIGNEFVRKGWIPRASTLDAFHVAYASVYLIDFLLTWNCTHLANENIRRPIERWLRNLGKHVPVICTPTELMSKDHGR